MRENPHEVGSITALAWNTGWTSWFATPVRGYSDCCDIPFGGGYVATTTLDSDDQPLRVEAVADNI